MCYGGSKITSKIFVYDPSSTLVLLWSGASSVQTSIIILILVCQLSFIIDRKAEESRKLSDKYLVYCQFLSSLIFVWHRKTRRVKTTLRQISSYLPVLIVSHLCLTGRKERKGETLCNSHTNIFLSIQFSSLFHLERRESKRLSDEIRIYHAVLAVSHLRLTCKQLPYVKLLSIPLKPHHPCLIRNNWESQNNSRLPLMQFSPSLIFVWLGGRRV